MRSFDDWYEEKFLECRNIFLRRILRIWSDFSLLIKAFLNSSLLSELHHFIIDLNLIHFLNVKKN